MTLGEAIAQVAPLYNLALIIIAVILFLVMFSYGQRFAYIKPWKILFVGIIILIAETLMTILRSLGLIKFHPAIFPFFELIIITAFIYMLLLQKQYVKTGKKE